MSAPEEIKNLAKLRLLERSLEYASEAGSLYLAENQVLRAGLNLIADMELTPCGHIPAGKKVYTQDQIDEIKRIARLYLSKAAEVEAKGS